MRIALLMKYDSVGRQGFVFAEDIVEPVDAIEGTREGHGSEIDIEVIGIEVAGESAGEVHELVADVSQALQVVIDFIGVSRAALAFAMVEWRGREQAEGCCLIVDCLEFRPKLSVFRTKSRLVGGGAFCASGAGYDG